MTSRPSTARAVSTVQRVLASLPFFLATVALFTLSALAIALSAQHDLLFDEGYHMGIIRILSTQWTPFIQQTDDQAWLGDLSRFGSYLYHYVMSFPLRALVAAGASIDVQFFVLRTLTLLLAAGSLWWFRRTLLLAGVSRSVTHLSIFAFAAIPLTSFSAATINYDNLLILIASAFFARTLVLATASRPRLLDALFFVILGVLACLTKFTFLPVLVATTVVLGVLLLSRRRAVERVVDLTPVREPRRRPSWGVVAAVVVAVIVIGLFAERYVVSFLLYRSPQPDCDAIHSVDFCRNYAPWARNEEYDAAAPDRAPGLGSLLAYASAGWTPALVKTFSTVGWAAGTSEGAPITAALVVAALVAALVLCLVGLPRALRTPAWAVLVIPFVAYVGTLFARNYGEYLRFDITVAVSARYILPHVPLIIGLAASTLGTLLLRARWGGHVAAAVAVVAVLLATQGGFASSFFALSDASWISDASPIAGLYPFLHGLASTLLIGG